MTVGVESGQAQPPAHVCRYVRQHPDSAHVARCVQCDAEYRIALIHEFAHECLIDLAGREPGACMRCGSVFSADRVESAREGTA